MGKTRLEAFSDGVIAIIITIMVLEMKVPHGVDFESLRPILPVFLSYVLSFINVGIYWNNHHHHLLHAIKRVSGLALWANLHLLFWLSLLPFTTGWMGENHFAELPLSVYGANLLMCGVGYGLFYVAATRHGQNEAAARLVGKNVKGMISVVLYAAAIPLAFVSQWIAGGLYVAVAAMWLVPDPRIEKRQHELGGE